MIRPTLALLTMIAAIFVAVPAHAGRTDLASPDGQVRVTLSDDNGTFRYGVVYRGETVLKPSTIGLELSVGGRIAWGLRITGVTTRESDSVWTPIAGKHASVRDQYRAATVNLVEPNGKKLSLEFRTYDGGVAFRYIVPQQAELAAVEILSESSRFEFAGDFDCLGFNVGKFQTSHEGEFDPVRPSTLRPHSLFDRPFVCKTPAGHGLAITEADLRNWGAMYLKGDNGGAESVLSPQLDNPLIAVRTRIGSDIVSPWRVVLLAESPGKLAESMLVQTLNPPTTIADTSWITPGKAAWDWWSGPALRDVPNAGMNMPTLKRLIDFSSDSGFPYLMIDEGWYAGAGGGGVVRPGADVTRTSAEIDMPALVDYAARKRVGLFLWLNWKALDAQFDEALDQYAAWGIKGLKIDFMDRDDQEMVAWYHRVLRETAKRRLMVDLHGAYPPTGLTRTYPHLVTQEGVMGAEYSKFSSRSSAENNVRLAYTRNLLGTTDYTPGGFGNVAPADHQQRWILPIVPYTRAHTLALYVVYDSALAFVADSPDRYADSPAGFDMLKAVPTSWDETRFVAGSFGETIAIARRKGSEWWIGALTGSKAASLRIPLAFLGPGAWTADIREDGHAPTELAQRRQQVTRATMVTLRLNATGGAIARLTREEGK